MNTAANIVKFEEGNIYEMRYIGDSELRTQWICVKRTATTVTLERFQSPEDSMKRKIKVWDGAEYVLEGNYSMAPVVRASRVVG